MEALYQSTAGGPDPAGQPGEALGDARTDVGRITAKQFIRAFADECYLDVLSGTVSEKCRRNPRGICQRFTDQTNERFQSVPHIVGFDPTVTNSILKRFATISANPPSSKDCSSNRSV